MHGTWKMIRDSSLELACVSSYSLKFIVFCLLLRLERRQVNLLAENIILIKECQCNLFLQEMYKLKIICVFYECTIYKCE